MCRTCCKRHNSYDFDPSSGIQHDGSLESVNSVNIGFGTRSPGKFSFRGRNMKEYEEQLSHLKNENFSLKLRVYFLEERMEHKDLNDDDDICKANMELKVETESLKKELYEKQELVRQASILLSTLEDQYAEKMQRVQTENLIQKEEMQERIYLLEKMEPEIEIRVQEIIERDRIIEEKMEQLDHQNKILVEIQITLDEQQKQNAELEFNLSQVKQLLQEKSDQLDVSCGTVKELAQKLMVVEKENNKLSKDMNRKEKKVQDLKNELKETLDMLQKRSLESNVYRNDSVKEMAEDEHEGLWTELELRKKEVETLRKEKETALQESEMRMLELERRAAFAERLLINTHAKEAFLNSDHMSGFDPNSEKLKQLQGKLFKGQGSINNLDLIKEILQGFSFDKNSKPEAITNSKDTKEDKEPPKKENDSNSENSKSNYSNLENALFAHMGQKVYNTSQTFNTYVLPGSNDDENCDVEPGPQVIPCAPTELYEKPIPKVPDNSNNSANMCCDNSTQEAEVKKLSEEMAKIKWEAKALREDREIITEKLNHLRNASKKNSSKKSPDPGITHSRIPIPKKSSKVETMSTSDKPLQSVMEELKNGLKKTKKIITLQMFDMASKKYRESVQKYKQEICSLRTRLADSHNACDMLRTRLEELVEFLEQIVDMDRKGIINLSSWTPQRRATLYKTINDSRALSHSLSQSLMIGMDSMFVDESQPDDVLSVMMDRIPQEIDLSRLDASVATLNDTVDVFDISFDLSTADTTSMDMIYESIEAKINCQLNAKANQIEDMADKIGEINDLIISKDNDLRSKSSLISDLKSEVFLLRDEIGIKNEILSTIKNEPKAATLDRACSPLECVNQKIEEDLVKRDEEIEKISNEKRNQEALITKQQILINELTESVQSYQKQLESTVESKKEVEKEMERVDSKILCVTKENFNLLVDKTNLQSQLSSADATVNFLKKDRERSVSSENIEHNYEKLLSHYKTYQTAVVDLKAQNDRILKENEVYKLKSEVLQNELKEVCGMPTSTDRDGVLLENLHSSCEAIEYKYKQLQSAYDNIMNDKAMLEERLHNLEPKLLMERSNLIDYRAKETATKQLDYHCLSDSNKENSLLRAKLVQYENATELGSLETSLSNRSLEFLEPNQLDHYLKTSVEHITSPNRSQKCPIDTVCRSLLSPHKRRMHMDPSIRYSSDQLEHITSPNRSPKSSRDAVCRSLLSPHKRQLHMDPALSRDCSDPFSNRNLNLNDCRCSSNNVFSWQRGIECAHELCTDPSHSQLLVKNNALQQYNLELEESLRNTKASLKDTLDSVTTAKEKQESVERAICKQLNKTHNVLRKAKGNLKRNEKVKQSDDE